MKGKVKIEFFFKLRFKKKEILREKKELEKKKWDEQKQNEKKAKEVIKIIKFKWNNKDLKDQMTRLTKDKKTIQAFTYDFNGKILQIMKVNYNQLPPSSFLIE